MARSRFPSDLATRPLGAFLIALPILVVLCYSCIVLLGVEPGKDQDVVFLIPGLSFRIPPDLRRLLVIAAGGALGGALHSYMLSIDEDLRSAVHVAAATLITAVLGMITALAGFVALYSALGILLIEAVAFRSLNPWLLSFLAIIAGFSSPNIMERVRLIGQMLVGPEPRTDAPPTSASATASLPAPQTPMPASINVAESASAFNLGPAGYAPSSFGVPGAVSAPPPSVDIDRALSELADRVASLQPRADLDNFDGLAIVRLFDDRDNAIPLEDAPAPAAPSEGATVEASAKRGKHAVAPLNAWLKLRVSFDGIHTSSEEAFQGRVQIKNGRPSGSVTFRVNVESEKIEFTPATERTTFAPDGLSRGLLFSFKTPSDPGTYSIFVEVMQKLRLVHVVTVALVVRGD